MLDSTACTPSRTTRRRQRSFAARARPSCPRGRSHSISARSFRGSCARRSSTGSAPSAPAPALDAIDLPATDNPLPRRLHQQAGLSSRQLAKSAATLLDVDTPTDAALLARHPKCPPELRSLPAWQEILADRIEALMRLVTTPDKELLVAGRVGAPVWTFIETQTACRVRMLAEERGMQAAGRDTSGEARSALGFL